MTGYPGDENFRHGEILHRLSTMVTSDSTIFQSYSIEVANYTDHEIDLIKIGSMPEYVLGYI